MRDGLVVSKLRLNLITKWNFVRLKPILGEPVPWGNLILF